MSTTVHSWSTGTEEATTFGPFTLEPGQYHIRSTPDTLAPRLERRVSYTPAVTETRPWPIPTRPTWGIPMGSLMLAGDVTRFPKALLRGKGKVMPGPTTLKPPKRPRRHYSSGHVGIVIH